MALNDIGDNGTTTIPVMITGVSMMMVASMMDVRVPSHSLQVSQDCVDPELNEQPKRLLTSSSLDTSAHTNTGQCPTWFDLVPPKGPTPESQPTATATATI